MLKSTSKVDRTVRFGVDVLARSTVFGQGRHPTCKYPNFRLNWTDLTPFSVISRPEHIELVFKDSDKHTKATNADSGYFMSWVLGKCLGLMSGQPWKTLKAAVSPALFHRAATDNLPVTRRQIGEHFRQLERTGNLSRGAIHPVQDMKMIPFFNVAWTIYGNLTPAMVEELTRLAPLREQLFKHVVFGGLTRFSVSQFLPLKANQELKEFKAAWRKFNAAAYEASKEKHQNTLVYSLYTAAEQGKYTIEEIDQTMDEMLYANLDVTTAALSWNLVFLAANPACRERLEKEIRDLYEEEENLYLAKSDTYLAACTLESARLRPVAPFTIPQAPSTERIVDGYRFPAKTNFVVDTWALNVRNHQWAPDNNAYRPERFLGADMSKLRYKYWRYGFGPRQCLGKYTADIVIRAVLLHLVKNYKLSTLEHSEWASDPECWMSHPELLIGCSSMASP